MDNAERNELSRNVKSIRDSIPRNYVERGVNRREFKRNSAEESSIDYQPRPLSDYRDERIQQDEQKKADQIPQEPRHEGRFHRTGATYGSDGKDHSASKAYSKRFQSRSSRPARQLEPDEEPPLIDTFREAAERRKQNKRDFEERYEHSKNGASRIEQHREKEE